MARGISSRAVAIMRTISSVETGGRSASGVPATRTSMLMGTDSGWGSCAASVRSISQRSSTDSPMPMMPPEQMVIPASRTFCSVRRRSSYSRVVMMLEYAARLVSRLWLYAVQPASFRRRACPEVSIPSVQHASSPSARTPRTISSTRSNCGPSLTSRHAAPMQKRVAPASRELRAAARTSEVSISGWAGTKVW